MLILLSFQVHAADILSTKKINLKVKKIQLSKILVLIEKESGCSFFYNSKELTLDQIVSVNLEGKSINQVMDRVLQGTK